MLRGQLFVFGFPTLLAAGVAVAFYGYFANARGPIHSLSNPGLYVDIAEKDFGEVPQGSILKSEFVVTNRYAEAIELRKVAGGCSCQEVTVEKSNLEPGESARISAVWKVSGARHRIRESIWITHTLPTNDKIDAGQMRLRLTADVHPEIEVTPEELKFEAGVPKKVTLQFRAGTKPDF